MFVCAGNGEEFSFAQSVGVGLIQSAINLTKICQNNSVSYLVFVGSAGSYDPNIPLLSLYCGLESVQIEASLFCSSAYTPIALKEKSLEIVSHETISQIRSLNLPQALINSSNYITTDRSISQKMQERGILLENMEFFSVLSVARAFNIPALGVFCVSNYCHLEAHQEFMNHRVRVTEKIEDFFTSL